MKLNKIKIWPAVFKFVAPMFLLGFAVGFENCSQVRFTGATLATGITGAQCAPTPRGGTDTCVSQAPLAPQIQILPTSVEAQEVFQLTVTNSSTFESVSVNFGDNTPVANVVISQTPQIITHAYATQGTYQVTAIGMDNCGTFLTTTTSLSVGSCVPEQTQVNVSYSPTLPVNPPLVAPANVTATINNAGQFESSTALWYLDNAPTPLTGGAQATVTALTAGNHALQAKATDTCGSTRSANGLNFCVAAQGNPQVTVSPASFVAGVANTFTVSNPGAYTSLTINFGDGTQTNIATTGAGAGVTTHTYANATASPIKFSYTISAVDNCGAPRSTSVPVSVGTCQPTVADGCNGSNYCTGRTTCNPNGSCGQTCGQCGFNGGTVNPLTSCNGNQQCTSGGTSCTPTESCSNVCGQCGYFGSPISPITSCKGDQQCITTGTTCSTTTTCNQTPGACGYVPPPTPTPTPPVSPVAPPYPVGPQPTPGDCNSFCKSFGSPGGSCIVSGFCSDVTCPYNDSCVWCTYCQGGVCACSLLTSGSPCTTDRACYSGQCLAVGVCK